MALEGMRAHCVTGSPVINIGQKRVHLLDCLTIVTDMTDKNRMELIFFIAGMGQLLKEGISVRRALYFTGKAAETGHADANDSLGCDGRKDTRVKLTVGRVPISQFIQP
jgi:hypothetical protein